MKPVIRFIALVSLIGLCTGAGCDKKSSTGPDEEDSGDTLTILSVTPDSGIVPGVETAFTVTVEYELVSAESGELNIGFNSVEVGRYLMLTGAKTVVSIGSGQHVFNVSVVPQDWGAAGDFILFVNLAEYPHGSTYTPLAWAYQALSLN